MLGDKKNNGGRELYFIDDDGNKQDSIFHYEILGGGDEKKARSVSDSIAKELGLQGFFKESDANESSVPGRSRRHDVRQRIRELFCR